MATNHENRAQKRLLLFLAAFPIVLAMLAASASLQSGEGQRRPLDLPSGGKGDVDTDGVPDSTPDQVQFYGQSFEGDSFVWCLDRSSSMAGSRFDQLKEEVLLAVISLSSQSRFDLVAFSTGHEVWAPRLRRATPQNRQSAMGWIQNLQPWGLTCLGEAVVESLEILTASPDRHRNLILVGDGMPYCGAGGPGLEETQDYILSANWQMIPISTIFLGDQPLGEQFMRT
ncbi:MAG TPA: VWA domain-containing protein, partial [Planctomycetes bacterium]|nr:VWA domain-containing protein [Planctomycetota bacterium]HIN79558.1 VWA domain-containing protein [Planctomycetota bacterium]